MKPSYSSSDDAKAIELGQNKPLSSFDHSAANKCCGIHREATTVFTVHDALIQQFCQVMSLAILSAVTGDYIRMKRPEESLLYHWTGCFEYGRTI